MNSKANKLAVALIGAVVTVLAVAGIEVNEEVVTAVTTLATAALVYFVPNHS